MQSVVNTPPGAGQGQTEGRQTWRGRLDVPGTSELQNVKAGDLNVGVTVKCCPSSPAAQAVSAHGHQLEAGWESGRHRQRGRVSERSGLTDPSAGRSPMMVRLEASGAS